MLTPFCQASSRGWRGRCLTCSHFSGRMYQAVLCKCSCSSDRRPAVSALLLATQLRSPILCVLSAQSSGMWGLCMYDAPIRCRGPRLLSLIQTCYIVSAGFFYPPPVPAVCGLGFSNVDLDTVINTMHNIQGRILLVSSSW